MEEEAEEAYFREVSYSNSFPVAETVASFNESNTPAPETKKRRNFSGIRDPDAEVIALSPKALLATNRFVCEICNKGFQRDQNLQLHRRGHNLPWKLRQRTTKDVRKRVYICPETSCVHHDPARALGDLTGIKKHFCRKHGEKKHRCDRCSKKYAVLSDLKAHVKTCGSRECRCDCGTLFSRRDSFITHRAFCDALAKETASSGQPPPPTSSSSPLQPVTPCTEVLSPVLSAQSSELPGNRSAHLPVSSSDGGIPEQCTRFCGVVSSENNQSFNPPPPRYATLFSPISDSVSLTLSPSLYGVLSSFSGAPQNLRSNYAPPPVLSATALLQKAAQMGTTTSDSSNISPMAAVSAEKWSMPSHFDELRQSSLFGDKAATMDFLGLGMGGSGFFNGGSDISGETFSAMCSGMDAWNDDSLDTKPSVL